MNRTYNSYCILYDKNILLNNRFAYMLLRIFAYIHYNIMRLCLPEGNRNCLHNNTYNCPVSFTLTTINTATECPLKNAIAGIASPVDLSNAIPYPFTNPDKYS